MTQPGKVAVIYAHNREGDEYRRYLRFLRASGYLSETIEELEVEPTPDVQGLKVLRFTVAPAPAGTAAEFGTAPEKLLEVARELTRN